MAPDRPIGRKRPWVEQMTQQKLQVSPCPRRASGHAWRLARERSTRECEAEACPCGLVRMTSYRTGQVVAYERSDGGIGTGARPQRKDDEPPSGDQVDPGVNELPSIALTTKFLELCRQCGSEQLAVRIVAAGRSTGAPGLPPGNDWTAWNAGEMRAAVEHLQHKLGR